MNSEITINGNRLRTVVYQKPLYRANSIEPRNNHSRANNHYGTNYNRFFATIKNETTSYSKNLVKAYTKEWNVKEPLHLINIMDLDTRRSLEYLLPNHQKGLDTAFPVHHNKVYRYSETHTAQVDASILEALCSLRTENGTPIDGYYMKQQRISPEEKKKLPDKLVGFHSEIGLCRSALHKLDLQSYTLKRNPPKINKQTKKRNANRIIVSPSKKGKMGALFVNSNSNNNNNNTNNNGNKKNNRKASSMLDFNNF